VVAAEALNEMLFPKWRLMKALSFICRMRLPELLLYYHAKHSTTGRSSICHEKHHVERELGFRPCIGLFDGMKDVIEPESLLNSHAA
jgi:hypothetical protein